MKLVLIFYVHQILFFFLTKILVDGFAEIGL